MRLVVIVFATLVLAGTAIAQDYTSGYYCNPVCLLGGGGRGGMGGYDCSYHNLQQCLATRSGYGGTCTDNPFISLCQRPGVVHSVRHPRHY
jgi:hypothetical protein